MVEERQVKDGKDAAKEGALDTEHWKRRVFGGVTTSKGLLPRIRLGS